MNNTLSDGKTISESGDAGAEKYQLVTGSRFGMYRIIRPLGRGGMGEVYEVEHTVLEKRYALKLLPPEISTKSGMLDRFKREAKVMAQLQHAHIINVDEFGETDNKLWLRMELAEGVDIEGNKTTSLQEYAAARGGKIPQEEYIEILIQILQGLQYAHERGAIHRDLKPANILLCPQPSGSRQTPLVKISDFGLVRLVGEDWLKSRTEHSVSMSMSVGVGETEGGAPVSAGTSTRALLGTYEYMSPEQKRGESAGERSDIYALGLLTYKLLTGENLGMKTPSRIDKNLLPAWDELAERALEQNPGERFASAGEMLQQAESIRHALVNRETMQQEKKKEEEERRRRELERKKQAELEQARQRRIENYLNEARAAMGVLDYDKAVKHCDLALEIDRDNGDAGSIKSRAKELESSRREQQRREEEKRRQEEQQRREAEEKRRSEEEERKRQADRKRQEEHRKAEEEARKKRETEEQQRREQASRSTRNQIIGMVAVVVVIVAGLMALNTPKKDTRQPDTRTTTTISRSAPTTTVRLPPTTTVPAPRPGKLYVETEPTNARVRILNINPRFEQGIELEAGRYNIEVSASGYETRTSWESLSAGETKRLRIALTRTPVSTAPAPRAPVQTTPARFTNSIGQEFVYIKPGTFMMGSPANESGRFDDERQHRVTLTKGYYMQTTEVTQGQWRAVMGSNPSRFSSCGDTCPVEQVSWDDAQQFIRKLNQKEGTSKYRLPTEAEWEYAARAGTTTAYNWVSSAECSKMMYENDVGSSEDKCVDYVRRRGLTPDSTAPVKSYESNAWGLYDMHGNVWEWVQDWFASNYPAGSVTDPPGPSSGSYRVFRGGSWYNNARFCRSAFRYNISPGFRFNYLGFRLVAAEVIR